MSGVFGTGRLLATSLCTILFTKDGAAFVGAITPQALLSAVGQGGHGY